MSWKSPGVATKKMNVENTVTAQVMDSSAKYKYIT